MSELLQRVVNELEAIAPTDLVWPRGLLHQGGPHRRIRGMFTPISIGADECEVFGNLVEAFRPQNCFIIGNAFGLSAAYIALKMQECGGKSVVTLDSQGEGDGKRCASVAQALADRLHIKILKNKKGFSPQDIEGAVEHEKHDLVFIDGAHRHPQVTRDFDGITPYTDDRTIIVWHDYWLPGIPECVRVAQDCGFHCLWLPTSCEVVLGVKDPGIFAQLQKTFAAGTEPPRRHTRIMGPAITLVEFIKFLGISLARIPFPPKDGRAAHANSTA